MKTFLFVPVVAALAALSLPAQDALPSGDKLMERYIEVTGGRAAYEKHRSESETGTMEMVGKGIKGTIQTIASAPNNSYATVDIDGVGKIESGSNGNVFWEKSALQGPRIKSGGERNDMLRETTFNAPLYWKKFYSSAKTTGTETVYGKECYQVVLTPAEGKPETYFFEKDSGLLVRKLSTHVSPMGELPSETLLSDYRKVDGILVPFSMTQKVVGQEIQMHLQKVEFNKEVPATTFALPDEIQALAAKK